MVKVLTKNVFILFFPLKGHILCYAIYIFPPMFIIHMNKTIKVFKTVSFKLMTFNACIAAICRHVKLRSLRI